MPGPPTPETPAQAGLLAAVGAFLGGTLLSGLLLGIAGAATGYRQGAHQSVPLAVTAFGLLGLWAGLVGGIILYGRFWAQDSLRKDLGLYFKVPFDVAIGLVAGVGTQLVLIPLLYFPFEQADPTLRHRLEAPAKTDTAGVHGAWQISVLFLLLAVGAPVVEELFFRGLLMRSLTRWKGPLVGIGASAVVFGLAHFELLQLPALLLFGLILGTLAYKTGRLGPGIVAHAAFNAVTVITLTVYR